MLCFQKTGTSSKRYISIIKADFLNNCKNEYKNRNTCFHAKCALAQLDDKQYQKEVFANLSSINSKDLVEYYLPSVSFIRIPESSNLLVKIMNDNTCKMIYDFDTNEQEPCSAKVINTIVEMTSNVPQELKKVSNGASPDSKKVEQSKKWINQNKNKLKMRTETY